MSEQVNGWSNWETLEVINWISTGGLDDRYSAMSDPQALASAMAEDYYSEAREALSGVLLSFALESIKAVNWLEIAEHIIEQGEE